MKKHIFIPILAVILALCAAAPSHVFARGEGHRVQDDAELLSDIEALDELALEASRETGVNVCLYISGDCDEMDLEEYADSLYKPLFGDADGIALVHCTGNETWLIAEYGAAKKFITGDAEDELGAAYLLAETFDEGALAYFHKAQEILEGLSLTPAVISQGPGEDEPVAPGTTGEGPEEHPPIPDERLLPRLVDNADLLSDEEEGNLLAQLDEISERQRFDVAIVTVHGLDGKTPMEYADDFFDYNGYGIGDTHDGILLLVSMEFRDYWVSTCGFGEDAFRIGSDSVKERFESAFLPQMSDGDYAKCFENFAKQCDKFVTEAKKGTPYDIGHLPKGTVPFNRIFIYLGAGLLIACAIANKKKEKLTSVRLKRSAEDYTRPGSMALTANSDRLVRKYVTSRKIQSSSGGSHSSSGSHTSSSGRSHGGGGGKF